MRLVRIIYLIAALYGIAVLLPGVVAGSGTATPVFYYGFFGSALVWQIAFLAIAYDPERLRLLIPITVLEKAAFFVPCLFLRRAGTLPDALFYGGLADGVLMAVFAFAWWRSGTVRQAG